MSHRHTVGSPKLREDLAEQTKLALDYELKFKRLRKELEAEKKKMANEKAALYKKLKDAVSQRDCVALTGALIIQEWKDPPEGKDFAADMGLLGSEVATQEKLSKLREALGKVYPSAD